MSRDWLDEIRFDRDGLVPAIAQDAATGQVLMLAWMDRDAVRETARLGEAVYYSRSRGRSWRKGESSGNTQRVVEMRLDCDGDTLLLKVEQRGGIACHTGREHCLFRRLKGKHWQVTEPVLRDPEELYGK